LTGILIERRKRGNEKKEEIVFPVLQFTKIDNTFLHEKHNSVFPKKYAKSLINECLSMTE
jgi:hypothetical protein